MNTSMHDTFNLSWKLNLVLRGLASPSLLETYSHERKKIAQDLITFDFEHANAFEKGDKEALARNFEENIAFISGAGVRYWENALNAPPTYSFPTMTTVKEGGLKAGEILTPARVTRYIDANPVDLQLDIPMLSQFRLLFFTNPTKSSASSFLSRLCTDLASPVTVLGRATLAAETSYELLPQPSVPSDEFQQPQRYTPVSKLATFGLVVTGAPKSRVEISDLPDVLQESRWSFYVDDVMSGPSCAEKWCGGVDEDEAVVLVVRPDGYVGGIGRWNTSVEGASEDAVKWVDRYFGAFLMD